MFLFFKIFSYNLNGHKSSGNKFSVSTPLNHKNSLKYSKVENDSDNSDEENNDQIIEFNDIDMSVKEFNPFSR